MYLCMQAFQYGSEYRSISVLGGGFGGVLWDVSPVLLSTQSTRGNRTKQTLLLHHENNSGLTP